MQLITIRFQILDNMGKPNILPNRLRDCSSIGGLKSPENPIHGGFDKRGGFKISIIINSFR